VTSAKTCCPRSTSCLISAVAGATSHWRARRSCAAIRGKNSLSVVQLIEQRLGLLQARRIKSFGEPAVDRSEKITGFATPVLLEAEARQADRCMQFQELCALHSRYRDSLVIAPLRRGRIAREDHSRQRQSAIVSCTKLHRSAYQLELKFSVARGTKASLSALPMGSSRQPSTGSLRRARRLCDC
jgi:hypothetical protein